MWNWIRNNGTGILAVGAVITALHFSVGSINHRIDDTHRRLDDALGRLGNVNQGIRQSISDLKAAVEQRFDAQDARIDDLATDINRRFENFREDVNRRFEDLRADMNQRFDAQDKRIEDLARGLVDLRTLGDRVSRNEGQINVIMQQLQDPDESTP